MNNIEFEKKVLANILLSSENIQKCLEGSIRKIFFQYDETAKLFEIILWNQKKYNNLLQKDSLPPLLNKSKTISEDLKKKIIMVFEELPSLTTVSNFDLLLDGLREYHEFNSLSRTFKKSMDEMSNKDTKAVIKRLKQDVLKLEQETNPSAQDSGFFAADAEHIIEEYKDRAAHPEKYIGAKVGIPDLDEATNGLEEGTVTYIMGQMKSAKSVLMMNMVSNCAKNGLSVYYHINEGSKRMVQNRLISCDTGIPYDLVRNSNMSPEQYIQYEKYLREQQSKGLIYLDRVPPSMSSAQYIDGKINDLKGTKKFDIIMIDMISNMYTSDPEAKEYKKLGIIALELKDLAMRHKVPVVILAHVNRKGMGKKKQAKKSYELDEAGLSLEPLKVVDLILSWKIDDPDTFKHTKQGDATLSLKGERDSGGPPDISLYVNTKIMKIEQHIISVGGAT